MKFGLHNPSWLFGADPAEIFPRVTAERLWAEQQRLCLVLGDGPHDRDTALRFPRRAVHGGMGSAVGTSRRDQPHPARNARLPRSRIAIQRIWPKSPPPSTLSAAVA